MLYPTIAEKTVTSELQENCEESICPGATLSLANFASDRHIILENTFNWPFSLVDQLTFTVEPVLLPGANDPVAAHVGQLARAMPDIVVELALVYGALPRLEGALAMSHAISPFSIVI